MEEKTEQSKNAINDGSVFILYFGTVYRFPLDMMKHSGEQPPMLNARIDRALEKGVGEMDTQGGYGCWYCRHYLFSENTASRCGYKGDPNIKLAVPSTHNGTGRIFIIQKEPCIVEESYIEVLADDGLLKPYETDMAFNFPKRKQIDELLSFEEISEVKPAAEKAEAGKRRGIAALVRGMFP